MLKAILETYRHHLEGLPEEGHLGKDVKPTDWMFAGEKRGTSMNLPNLVRRTIIPNLTRCSVCHSPKHLHKEQDIYTLGVKPKVIQAILRHSDIATTLSFYVETPEAEPREALDKLIGLMK